MIVNMITSYVQIEGFIPYFMHDFSYTNTKIEHEHLEANT